MVAPVALRSVAGSAGGGFDRWSGVGWGGVVVAGLGAHVAAGDGPFVGLLGEQGADETDHRGAVGEDPHDVGAPADLYPALGAGSMAGMVGVLDFDDAEVAGQGVGDVFVADAFAGPAALLGVVA